MNVTIILIFKTLYDYLEKPAIIKKNLFAFISKWEINCILLNIADKEIYIKSTLIQKFDLNNSLLEFTC